MSELTVTDVLALIDAEIARYDAMDAHTFRVANLQSLTLGLFKTKILEAKIARVESAAPDASSSATDPTAPEYPPNWTGYTLSVDQPQPAPVTAPRVPDALNEDNLPARNVTFTAPDKPIAPYGYHIAYTVDDAFHYIKNGLKRDVTLCGVRSYLLDSWNGATLCPVCEAWIQAQTPAPVPSPDSASRFLEANRVYLDDLKVGDVVYHEGWEEDIKILRINKARGGKFASIAPNGIASLSVLRIEADEKDKCDCINYYPMLYKSQR